MAEAALGFAYSGLASTQQEEARPPVSLAPLAADTDDALLARLGAGDERAFTELVRRHTGRLTALAKRFTGRADHAEDIVQEVFLAVWRSRKPWTPGGPPFAAYLTRLAMNRCIDHSRRQKFRRFIGLEEAPEPMDPGQSPAAAAEARSEVGAVARLVLDLPARQRAAILVAAEGGQSSSEVAAVLGISTGAAEQLLVRARRTLRARLAAAETKGENDDDR